MSIFNLYCLTDEQEETSSKYQEWRDANPDNPSDDDFYLDSYTDDYEPDDATGDEPENVKPWLGWFGL